MFARLLILILCMSLPVAASAMDWLAGTGSDGAILPWKRSIPGGDPDLHEPSAIIPQTGTGTGLAGTYFDRSNFTGAVRKRIDPTIDFAWGGGAPIEGISNDTFSVRWTGQVQAQYSETYTFTVVADTAAALWINGRWVVEWTDEYSGSIRLAAGQKYDLILELYELRGDAMIKLFWSSPSTSKRIIPSTQLYPSVLPQGWVSQDIGFVTLRGSARAGDGVYAVTGSGENIGGPMDGFHFVSRTLTGDGSIVARVTSLTNTDPWSKAGIMMREDVSYWAKNVFCGVTPANGIVFQRRAVTGQGTTRIPGSGSTAPRWLKLVRQGTQVSGYESPDGITWTEVGTTTVTFPDAVRIGLAVTSHDWRKRCTARFDHVLITPGGSG